MEVELQNSVLRYIHVIIPKQTMFVRSYIKISQPLDIIIIPELPEIHIFICKKINTLDLHNYT
uniref:Uncharacterized protein n=1 Tax=Aegilops tauschii subsp. strangulata TaxID=200361 RepID=A0A453TA14_AEGTS